MKQHEAEQIYSYYVTRTEELINSMGNNPQTINAFITNTYEALFQKESTFLWFSLGTAVSSTVGSNLQVATQASIHSASQAEPAKIVLQQLSSGNQAIFKNIVPLFLTYKSIGVEGIERLEISDISNPFKNEWVLKAIKNYSLLQAEQTTIASSLGLSPNDPKVIAQLFSDEKNIKLAHSVGMGIAKEEQETVQKIYKKELVDIMLDPTLGWLGHQAKLDEINILEKSYRLFDYIDDPADLEQRLHFAEILLTAVEGGISNGELSKFQADVHKMAAHTLWMANPHTKPNAISEMNGAYWGQQADEHDKKVKDSVLAFINNSKPSIAQHEDNLQGNDFAFARDKAQGKWKIVPDAQLPDFEIAPKKSMLTRSDYLFLPKGTSLKADTFFYHAQTKQLFHLRGQGSSSRPPDNDIRDWTYAKYVLVPREKMPHGEHPDFPNIANYYVYYITVKKTPVEKAELLSWLGDINVEEHHIVQHSDMPIAYENLSVKKQVAMASNSGSIKGDWLEGKETLETSKNMVSIKSVDTEELSENALPCSADFSPNFIFTEPTLLSSAEPSLPQASSTNEVLKIQDIIFSTDEEAAQAVTILETHQAELEIPTFTVNAETVTEQESVSVVPIINIVENILTNLNHTEQMV